MGVGFLFFPVCVDAAENMEKPKRMNVFVSGCTSYKLESIELHEGSEYHKRAFRWWSAKKAKPGSSVAEVALASMNAEVFDKISKMFRTCHALAKKNRPLSDFLWQCNLDELKGVTLGQTYRNRASATEFVKYIAESAFSDMKDTFEASKFVSIMGDDSTDISATEQSMWFLRTCIAGNVSVKFLGCISLEKADAASILGGLQQIVSENTDYEWPDFMQKVVACSTDGASVMLGRSTGVATRLKETQPDLIILHCLVHRLELGYKDASRSVKLYDKAINTLAMGLYYFYYRSPLNRTNLRRAAKFTESESSPAKVLFPTRVSGTRWVGHINRALDNIIKSYQYIILHLEQLRASESSRSASYSKAKCFLKLLKSKSVVCFLHFMYDVSSALMYLSKALQDPQCNIGVVQSKVKSALDLITKYKTSDGPSLRQVINSQEHHGTKLAGTTNEFNAARCVILDNIIKAMDKRFCDLVEDPIIAASTIANISSWPTKEERDDQHTFGDAEVVSLIDCFRSVLQRAGVDPVLAEIEWPQLRSDIYKDSCKVLWDSQKVPKLKSWFAIHKQCGSDYPNILALFDLLLCISPSSAEVERGFSQLKLIVTDRRNCLKGTTINSLLGIKLLTPDITEYDPEDAVNRWWRAPVTGRRPHFRDTKKNKKLPLAMEVSTEATENESEANAEARGDPAGMAAFELAVAADAHDEDGYYSEESGFCSDEEADVFRRLQDFSDC